MEYNFFGVPHPDYFNDELSAHQSVNNNGDFCENVTSLEPFPFVTKRPVQSFL